MPEKWFSMELCQHVYARIIVLIFEILNLNN